jgi:6-pyruvoyltetrahydropterin/6-carboxytetrahydropterin synthase
MVYLTRRYRLSASHRLYNAALTAEENARVYGKCANPYGHGHNYVLEVTLAGPVDPATGMVYDLAALDELVGREILERFDESHLNTHQDLFGQLVPTTENFCLTAFNLLKKKFEPSGRFLRAKLRRVRVEETSSNFFECEDSGNGRTEEGKVS